MAIFNSELLVYQRVNLPQKSTGTDHVGPTVGGASQGPLHRDPSPRMFLLESTSSFESPAISGRFRTSRDFKGLQGLQGLKMQR